MTIYLSIPVAIKQKNAPSVMEERAVSLKGMRMGYHSYIFPGSKWLSPVCGFFRHFLFHFFRFTILNRFDIHTCRVFCLNISPIKSIFGFHHPRKAKKSKKYGRSRYCFLFHNFTTLWIGFSNLTETILGVSGFKEKIQQIFLLAFSVCLHI